MIYYTINCGDFVESALDEINLSDIANFIKLRRDTFKTTQVISLNKKI